MDRQVYYQDGRITLYLGDCLEVMPDLPAQSIDAIVTDPPYGLAFMGKDWDHGVPVEAFWVEALRVAKPGAHLLAFGGTRTYHRLACAIEDAGWEIRDCIMWVYGSGFPKSMDVSKAIDKAVGVEGTFGEPKTAAHAGWIERGRMRGHDGHEGYQRPWMKDATAIANNACKYLPATEAAKQWQGWGTALKPAVEPIVVARKPLIGTVAANVLTHGTGAINVDGCRVATNGESVPVIWTTGGRKFEQTHTQPDRQTRTVGTTTVGRWPANLIHDGSDEVVGLFPAEDVGSAARFFYTAKAPADERNGSQHPTVKPLALMRYLVRLVTPPDALVLDPFVGSGTTLAAARLESCRAIGIDKSEEYCADALRRIARQEPRLF